MQGAAVVNNTLYTVPDNGNAIVAQMANNNRAPGVPGAGAVPGTAGAPRRSRRGSGRSKGGRGLGVSGPAFTALDQRIVALDQNYTLLVDKDPWVDYAFNIAGEWSLCANCQPDGGAKKLYRQYNFWRGLIDLPDIDAPVDDSATGNVGGIFFVYTDTPALQVCSIGITSIPPSGRWLFGQVGQAMGNPQIHTSPGDYGIDLSITSPVGVWLDAVAQGLKLASSPVEQDVLFWLCSCDDDGAPALRQLVELLYTKN